MTKEELNLKLDSDLTAEENALINFNVYYNPKYVEYYQNYHAEKYQECYDFLMANRHLLTIVHTPKDKKYVVTMMLDMLKKLGGDDVVKIEI